MGEWRFIKLKNTCFLTKTKVRDFPGGYNEDSIQGGGYGGRIDWASDSRFCYAGLKSRLSCMFVFMLSRWCRVITALVWWYASEVQSHCNLRLCGFSVLHHHLFFPPMKLPSFNARQASMFLPLFYLWFDLKNGDQQPIMGCDGLTSNGFAVSDGCKITACCGSIVDLRLL